MSSEASSLEPKTFDVADCPVPWSSTAIYYATSIFPIWNSSIYIFRSISPFYTALNILLCISPLGFRSKTESTYGLHPLLLFPFPILYSCASLSRMLHGNASNADDHGKLAHKIIDAHFPRHRIPGPRFEAAAPPEGQDALRGSRRFVRRRDRGGKNHQ